MLTFSFRATSSAVKRGSTASTSRMVSTDPITSFPHNLWYPDRCAPASVEILGRIRFSVKLAPTPALPAGPGVENPWNSDLTEF
jgi:hypothetical protein